MTVPAGGDEARWKTCLGLARDVLLLGPDGADLKLRYLQGPCTSPASTRRLAAVAVPGGSSRSCA